MTEVGSAEGDRDLFEVMVEEYLARHRRGEAESIGEFAERSAEIHPAQAVRIREELPGLIRTALALESVVAEPRPDAPLLKPGQMIRHYCVERHIGSGGMGEVYLARNTELDTSVAIKLLSPRYSSDPQLSAAFKREGRTAAKLDHRNVARVRDSFEHDGRNYLVMEFVEGQSLGELTKGGKPVPKEELLDVGIQIAQGLAAAHSRGIIHRDLKPHNVMINADGRVKILDFGLAKVDQARNRTSRDVGSSIFPSGVVVGTIGYMSPEQVCGDHVDARSDLFALGVVLYELATGLAPFRKSGVVETQGAILTERPKPVTTLNRDLPLELDRVIDKLLAKKPEDRYQSSEAVLEDLEALRSPRASEQDARPKSVSRITVLLALVAVVVGVVSWKMSAGRPAQRIDNFTEEESEGFRKHVEKEEVGAAWALLKGVEKRLGRPEPTARQLLEGKVDELLNKWRHAVEDSLAGGEEPAQPDDRIKDIDEIKEGLVRERPGADHEDVVSFRGDAVAEASALRSTVNHRSESIAKCLGSCPLDDAGSGIAGHPEPCRLETAWEEISSLRDLKFKRRAFKPATEAARARERNLVKALEERLQADTGDASFDSHADLLEHVESPGAYESLSNRCRSFKEHLDLLQRIKERNPGLEKFEKTRKKLERDRTLLELLRGTEALVALEHGKPGRLWQVTEADAGETEKKLDEVLRRMRETDPTDESAYTRRVSKTVGLWNVAAETIRRFEDKSLDAMPEHFAGDEAVRSAVQWLERYRKAEEDPLGARLEAGEKKLALRFQKPASDLLTKLEERIKREDEAAKERRLVNRIRERLRKLQLPTAEQRQELEELKSDDARELRAEVEKLELQLREWEKLEGIHAAVRRDLRTPKTLDPARLKRSLDDVSKGLEAQKDRLDEAIAFKPELDPSLGECDKELCWRRARVSLRLGEFADVLRDVSASGRKNTPEAQLVSCMARFGAREYAEASECAEAVLANPGSAQRDRARAHYWLATIAERCESRNDARDHFQQAIARGGSDAYAHNRLALFALDEPARNEGLLEQAVTHATECLSRGSPFSEDEMLTLFEGCSAADYRNRAIGFVCQALLSGAVAHFYLCEFPACIKDCDEAIRVSPKLADAYYWRAYARYRCVEDGAGIGGGDKELALKDCDKAAEYAADAKQRKMADDLKKLIEDMK